MRWGLSLSGGSLRGAAHIGIIKVLDKYGLRPDAIGGTSAGAIVAALYASEMTGSEIENFVLGLDPKKIFDKAITKCNYPLVIGKIIGDYLGINPPLKTPLGLFKGEYLAEQLGLYTMNRRLSDLKMALVINAVDLDQGDEVVFTNRPVMLQRIQDFQTDAYLWEAVRASISLPGIFTPFLWQNRRLVDGAVASLNPAKLLKKMGMPFVLAIDVSINATETPLPDNFLEVLIRSYDLLNYRKNRDELRLYADFVVRAGYKGVNLKEFSKLKDVIDHGEKAMERTLKKYGIDFFK